MPWAEAYAASHEPSLAEIGAFAGGALWDDLHGDLEGAMASAPHVEYSTCSMQRGWNVKYRKRGRSLCTLYPMEGYFIALVVGDRERPRVDARPAWGEVAHGLLAQASGMQGAQWLMVDVRNASTLDDAKELVAIRATS